MIRKSTSLQRLNADRGLGRLGRFKGRLYRLLNRVNNLLPYTFVDSCLEVRDFTCEDLDKYWNRLNAKSSPSRKLSDLFWLKLPWEKIRKELGEIHVLDAGCGSGEYGRKLTEWSNGAIKSYTGIDFSSNENWIALEKKYTNFSFYQAEVENILQYVSEKINFFMSQSAIEHFDEDLHFFRQISDYILSSKKTVIQVHLFPSNSCLRLYGNHGIRQYTPRTVSKITRLFRNFSCSALFRLGGDNCNHLHYEFITKPIFLEGNDWRDTRTAEYDRKLLAAIEEDMKLPQTSPAFYVLVIHSNGNNKIF